MSVVRELREQAGLTQVELARRAGTSQPTIAAYEAGAKSPTLRTLRRLAGAAGLDVMVSFVPPLTREDRRSLLLHGRIARRLRSDPQRVVSLARSNLDLMRKGQQGAHSLLGEWREILQRPPDDIIEVLTDAGPRARELRQVTPFAGVLSASERADAYRSFRESEAA